MTSPKDEPRDADGHLIRDLHGVTLLRILEYLVERIGWEEMGRRVPVRSFTSEPSVKSSLTFLRRTPWAREKVERLYVELREAEAKGSLPRGR